MRPFEPKGHVFANTSSAVSGRWSGDRTAEDKPRRRQLAGSFELPASVAGSPCQAVFRLAADDNQPGIVGAAHHGADYEHPLASRERRGADAVNGAVLATNSVA